MVDSSGMYRNILGDFPDLYATVGRLANPAIEYLEMFPTDHA
jgi:hypothetical protein